jgi:signal transduction histidine kinase
VRGSVLILDDRVEDRKLMQLILEEADFEVLQAGGGEEALAMVANRVPDLVIADLVMPTMNGYEFVRRLREAPGGAELPVIFCTGSYLEGEVERLASACGVHLFLSKPIDIETAVRAVEDALSLPALPPAPPPVPQADFDAEQLLLLNDKLVEKVLALQDLSSERQKLAAQLLHAHEDERERIANFLHDDGIQALAAVNLGLDRLRGLPALSEHDAVIADLRDAVGSAIERLRDLLAGLQSSELGSQPLVSALSIYLERMRAGGLEVVLHSEINDDPPPTTRTLLYRTAQEILMNVRKHSGASKVEVWASELPDCYCVRVRDDGCGFSVPDAMRVRPGHLGLPSVAARVELLGGTLRIDSRAGEGTDVELRVPRLVDQGVVMQSRR